MAVPLEVSPQNIAESNSCNAIADTEALLVHQSLSEVDTEDDLLPSEGGNTDPHTESKLTQLIQHPVIKFLKSWWRTIVIILPPILSLPLPLVWKTTESKGMYVIVIISVYWVTEVVPISVTALLPLVLFPALGVLSADDTARNYLKDSNMLFVGGLMMAVAIEKWNLHKRIGLLVLLLMGSKPKWLLLGFMSTTAFLSMWISNTATAAMMLPIAQAVLLEIKERDELAPNTVTIRTSGASVDASTTSVRYTRSYNSVGDENDITHSMDKDYVTVEENMKNEDKLSLSESNVERQFQSGNNVAILNSSSGSADKRFNKLAKSLMLGVAYSANIGGTGTLTGTGPNIILAGQASDLGINFGVWFAFATPVMLLALILSWVYLSVLYCDDSFQWLKKLLFKKKTYIFNSQRAKSVIKGQYKKLGAIRYAEILVLVMFLVLILLWLLREPQFIPGWGSIFDNSSYLSDATAVLAIVFLLFLIPSEPCCCSWKRVLKAGSSPRLLDWDSIQQKLPWNVIILLGSGFAIAEAAEQSGLSDWIGSNLALFKDVPPALIAFTISAMVATMTEFISNVATATLFLPILRKLGTSLCIHPLYLMIPATVSASYAFMVPVATPPNAIAFSYGYIKVYNMVFTGVFMNILCVGIVTFALNTVGIPIFGLNDLPSEVFNGTECLSNVTELN